MSTFPIPECDRDGCKLSPAHHGSLAAAAINDAIAHDGSVWTDGDALVFGYNHGVPGTDLTPQRRPDAPGKGEPKYRFGYKTSAGVHLIGDEPLKPGDKVFLVEGPKQGRAVASWAPEGFRVALAPGITMYGQDELSMFDGCEVVLVPDSDVKTKPGVNDGARKWKSGLEASGASVRISPVQGEGSDGADDVLAALATDDARRAWVEGQWAAAVPDVPRLIIAPAEFPQDAARDFLRVAGLRHGDMHTLRRWKGQYLRWNTGTGAYEAMDDEAVLGLLYKVLGRAGRVVVDKDAKAASRTAVRAARAEHKDAESRHARAVKNAARTVRDLTSADTRVSVAQTKLEGVQARVKTAADVLGSVAADSPARARLQAAADKTAADERGAQAALEGAQAQQTAAQRAKAVADQDLATAAGILPVTAAELSKLEEAGASDVFETEAPWNPNRDTVRVVEDALRHLPGVAIAATVQAPSWLGSDHPDVDPKHLVVCRNVIVDTRTRETYPHTPLLFTQAAVTFDYDSKARVDPRWVSFLESSGGGDPKHLRAAQEQIGYMATGRTDLQAVFNWTGVGGSGKSTASEALSRLCGTINVANPSMSSLDGRFALEPLLGKTLAVIGDAGKSTADARDRVLEVIKDVSGNGTQTVDRKGIKAVTGIRMGVRFLILSNYLPDFKDGSGAVARRFKYLPFQRRADMTADTTLEARFSAPEFLSGLFNWALDGNDRLNAQNGVFTVTEEAADVQAMFEESSSPETVFLARFCELGSGLSTPKDDLYGAFVEHYLKADLGRDYTPPKDQFTKLLYATGNGIKSARKGADGNRVQVFTNVRLKLVRVPGTGEWKMPTEGGETPGVAQGKSGADGPAWHAPSGAEIPATSVLAPEPKPEGDPFAVDGGSDPWAN